jgi:hypothetical protein
VCVCTCVCVCVFILPGGIIGNDSLHASNGFGYSLLRAVYTETQVRPFALTVGVDYCTRFGLNRLDHCSGLAYDGPSLLDGGDLHHLCDIVGVPVCVCVWFVC